MENSRFASLARLTPRRKLQGLRDAFCALANEAKRICPPLPHMVAKAEENLSSAAIHCKR
jgi:hypothetical protein